MGGVKVERLALNTDQIEQYNPPPNPAKTTDSRYTTYVQQFGDESWELDALEPQVIVDLITHHVLSFRDKEKWDLAVQEEKEARKKIRDVASKI
jgi:archaellum component FlaG (FlaF/FlaG flagellin family)